MVHQVPNNSITPSTKDGTSTLIDWPSISSTVIPHQAFSSIPLSLLVHPYRVLSHPICIYAPAKYKRNEFIFSFSLVLHHRTAAPAYASVVSKVGELFRHLEEESLFLSNDGSPPNTGRLYALCEILLEDLNNYCETMIPIDDRNTLNIKLFPSYPPPPVLKPHYVPLATVKLEELRDPNWDLTMLRILPWLDGVNSIRKISRKADADYKLVKKAVEHLLYYGCVTLLDIFTFGASYAPTAEIDNLVADRELQEECRRYVLVPRPSTDPGSGSATDPASTGDGEDAGGRPPTSAPSLDCVKLIELYCSMSHGLPLRAWCLEHADIMGIIDIRRFITFGMIKGILYRVHKYAITTIPSEKQPRRKSEWGKGGTEGTRRLEDFLDGKHTFDEICTELMMNEKELGTILKGMRDVVIIQK